MCYLLIPLSLPQAFSHEVTAEKPECDTILADSQNLPQLAHPKAVSVLQMKLHNLEHGWLDFRGHIGHHYISSCCSYNVGFYVCGTVDHIQLGFTIITNEMDTLRI